MADPAAIIDFTQYANVSALVSGCIKSTEPKSLTMMMPKSPICRSSPNLAPAACCFLGVPESNPASVTVAACTTCGQLEVELRISVFADDGGAISPRPGRWEIVGGDGAEHSEHVSSFNNSQRSNSRSLRLPHLGRARASRACEARSRPALARNFFLLGIGPHYRAGVEDLLGLVH